jgi:hypothetical protein
MLPQVKPKQQRKTQTAICFGETEAAAAICGARRAACAVGIPPPALLPATRRGSAMSLGGIERSRAAARVSLGAAGWACGWLQAW